MAPTCAICARPFSWLHGWGSWTEPTACHIKSTLRLQVIVSINFSHIHHGRVHVTWLFRLIALPDSTWMSETFQAKQTFGPAVMTMVALRVTQSETSPLQVPRTTPDKSQWKGSESHGSPRQNNGFFVEPHKRFGFKPWVCPSLSPILGLSWKWLVVPVQLEVHMGPLKKNRAIWRTSPNTRTSRPNSVFGSIRTSTCVFQSSKFQLLNFGTQSLKRAGTWSENCAGT